MKQYGLNFHSYSIRLWMWVKEGYPSQNYFKGDNKYWEIMSSVGWGVVLL